MCFKNIPVPAAVLGVVGVALALATIATKHSHSVANDLTDGLVTIEQFVQGGATGNTPCPQALGTPAAECFPTAHYTVAAQRNQAVVFISTPTGPVVLARVGTSADATAAWTQSGPWQNEVVAEVGKLAKDMRKQGAMTGAEMAAARAKIEHTLAAEAAKAENKAALAAFAEAHKVKKTKG